MRKWLVSHIIKNTLHHSMVQLSFTNITTRQRCGAGTRKQGKKVQDDVWEMGGFILTVLRNRPKLSILSLSFLQDITKLNSPPNKGGTNIEKVLAQAELMLLWTTLRSIVRAPDPVKIKSANFDKKNQILPPYYHLNMCNTSPEGIIIIVIIICNRRTSDNNSNPSPKP